MTIRPATLLRSFAFVVSAFAVMMTGGCLAYEVVATPVELAADTVIVTGKAADAAVKATGHLAGSAFEGSGRVGSAGIDAASRLAATGMVTFVDVGTGTVTRVPWRAGVTLAGAGATARVELARKAVDLVRAGALVFSSTYPAAKATPLASGDVVRIHG